MELELPIEYCSLADTSTNVGLPKKGRTERLGLSTPASQEAPASIYADGKEPEEHIVFLTINFPKKDKIRLNKKTNLKFSDYKTLEQRIIIKRISNLLEYHECKYIQAFEYCNDGNLHTHLLVKTKMSARDLKIEVNRYYNIHYPVFCDSKVLKTPEDVDHVLLYIIMKKSDHKKYQTSGFLPLFNDPKFLNIEELINKYFKNNIE